MNDIAIFCPDHLGKLLETDDWDVISEFYAMFCTQMESMLNEESFHPDRDLECIRQDAHRMISSCNTVGAFRLSQLFSNLETACQTATDRQLIDKLSAQICDTMEETLGQIQALQKQASLV